MRSGTVVGVEALVRWQHPTRGLLPPSDFLPTLEKHQLDIDLGLWVLDAALAQVEAWQAQGLALTISVNISALHLQQPDFVEHLRRALAAHPGLHPKSLEIEVVETSALQDIPNVSQVISACERLGVGFALDDFGTGYSSLTYLKHLPVGVLKIDRSFVRDMLHDPEDLAILEGIRGLAHAFRREVVAEGVETVEHGVMLLRLGCELAQGNGIARPMPAESVPRWVDEWRPPICWSQARRLRHSDLPLLYALIEHGAWIKAFEAHASGQRATPPPPLDLPELRFGQRLDGALDDGAGPDAEERLAIESLHRRMQELAQALLQRRSEGDRPGQDARLAEMHALNQRLQESLQHWQAGTA
jgi:EAL domain-containing protein (putative c-di-GMP-specific phosphodiesterase class I)